MTIEGSSTAVIPTREPSFSAHFFPLIFSTGLLRKTSTIGNGSSTVIAPETATKEANRMAVVDIAAFPYLTMSALIHKAKICHLPFVMYTAPLLNTAFIVSQELPVTCIIDTLIPFCKHGSTV